MPFAETAEGVRLWFQIEGKEDAPTLLFSNSLGTDLGLWDSQVPDLAERFRIVRYDTRGHGKSDAPEGPYTLDWLGRDALAVLEASGSETASVIGLSLGGMTAMWLGANAPHKVDRLVLANTAAQLGPPSLWEDRIAAVTASGMGAVTESVLERWFTNAFRASHPQEVERIRRMLDATAPQGYAGCCAAIRDMDLREDIERIAVPTLIICGSVDPATPPVKAQEIARHVEGAKLITLQAAHLSNIEQPEAFNAALEAFLSADDEEAAQMSR